MASYQAIVTARHSPDEVWRYLADLRSIAEWDPSVVAARLVSGEPGIAGASYELEVSFLGRTITLPYVTAKAEAPGLVVFSAETDLLSVRDEARIGLIVDGGSAVTWSADLRLKGPQRILDLPLRAAFNRLGRRAKRGLAERLNEPVLTRAGELVLP